MTLPDLRAARLAIVLVSGFIALIGYRVDLLPRELVISALTVLTAWLSLSVPVGVLVGHCVLSEGDCP